MTTDVLHAISELLDAGLVLAGIAEECVQSCGNSPPHPVDCPDCAHERDAIRRWAGAVVSLCRAAGPETIAPTKMPSRGISYAEAAKRYAAAERSR